MANEQEFTNGMDSNGLGESTILEIRDTSITFDMERGVSRVLNSVDMDVHRGEVLGVVGESGSGKSMFASALLDAVVQPGTLTGEIRYHPEPGTEIDILDLTDEELRSLRWKEIAMVFQGALGSWNPTITIKSHFRETLRAHNEPEQAGMERARQLLSELYLEPERVLESYPHELSGGMKQRALIALSLVLEPQVLVLDEPTAALDLLMQRSILALLDDLQRQYDLTMVFITHDLELVADIADRLAVMYAFEFAEVGPTEDIVLESRHPYTRALINSTPNLQTPVEMMEPISGESPDPVSVPEGCSYSPRCPMADELCEISDPDLALVEENHHSACHYWDEVDDTIPLSVEEVAYQDEGSDETESSIEATSTSTSRSIEKQEDNPVIAMEDVKVHFTETSGIIESIFSEPDVIRAVDGVDLEIGENDVIALVGESGCGKTTLGKTAIGLQEPTNGSVKYRGQDIWDAKNSDTEIEYKEIRRSLQIIHQDPGSSLNPNKTIHTTLSLPMEVWNPDLDAGDRQARIYGMLERVGMTPPSDYANRFPHQLSGGEKQRVALIRALLMNPDLILADEAVSALDVSLRVDMMDLLLELQDQFNTSFLFISHNLSNARYLAEKADGRIGIMYLGKIVEIGTADEIIKDPQHPYTKVLQWATSDLDPESEQVEDPPIQSIDIPDPINPPTGCRFHTRCPEAREVCSQQQPELMNFDQDREQRTACFRVDADDHEYWDSPSIVEEKTDTLGQISKTESSPKESQDMDN